MTKLRIFLIIVVAVLFLLAIVVGADYLNLTLPGISETTDAKIATFIGSLPVIPKTNRQILLATFYKNSKLNSYQLSGSLTIGSLESPSKDYGKIQINGAIEKGRDLNNYSLNLKGFFGTDSPVNNFKFESVENDGTFFFRVDNFPDLFGVSFSKISGNWYQTNVESLQKDMQIEARSDADIQKDITNFFKNSRDKIFHLAKRSEDPHFYYFSINLGKEDALDLLKKSLPTNSATISLKIEKKSLNLDQFDFTAGLGETSKPDLTAQIANSQLKLTAQLAKFNQKQEFSDPKGAKSFANLTQSLVTTSKQATANDLLNQLKQTNEVGADLLTVERLTHVFLLTLLSF